MSKSKVKDSHGITKRRNWDQHHAARIGTLPQLTKTQHTKLQHLTIVSLATRNKDIPYALLMSELGIASVRELEDVVISGIYADVFQAALDPQVQCILVIADTQLTLKTALVGVLPSTCFPFDSRILSQWISLVSRFSSLETGFSGARQWDWFRITDHGITLFREYFGGP